MGEPKLKESRKMRHFTRAYLRVSVISVLSILSMDTEKYRSILL